MSSKSATVAPLIPLVATAATGRNKKRRPNFRPRGKSVITKPPAALDTKDEQSIDDAAIKENDSSDDANEEKAPLNNEVGNAAGVDVATAPERKNSLRRNLLSRKRKIVTGVAVGFSRPKVSEEQDIEEAPPHTDQQLNHQPNEAKAKPTAKPAVQIPPDTSGAPKLSAYCARPKQLQRRKTRDDNNNTNAIAGRRNNRDQPQLPLPPPPPPETDTAGAPPAASGPVVQIINGEIVLQESSLVVHGAAKAEEEFQVVEEEAQLAAIGASYNSFVNRKAPSHWTVKETALFYEALRQVGTDFGTMEAYFGTKRTRKQLKRKYQIEMSKNPHLIDKALDPSSKKEIDLAVFEMTQETVEQLAEEAAAKAAAQALRAPPPPPPQAEVVVEEDANMEMATTTRRDVANPKPERTWWQMDEDDDQELKQENHIEEEESIVKDPLFEEEQEAEAQPTVALVLGVGQTDQKKKKKPKFRSKKLKGK